MLNINLFKNEFLRYLNSMLIWSIVICSLVVINMALFQVFVEQGIVSKIQPILDTPFMTPMMKGFGLDIDKLSNILGFYVIRNTPLILLLVGIFSIITSVSIFANEEYDKTSEFIFTRPLTRLEIFISKALVCFSHIIIINIIITIIGFISLELFKLEDYNRTDYFVHSIYNPFHSLTFCTLGFMLASIAKRGRGLFGISVGLVLGTYFLDIISKTAKQAEFIGYISPFRYVDTNILIENFNLNIANLLFFLLTSIILTVFSIYIFLKKDILN